MDNSPRTTDIDTEFDTVTEFARRCKVSTKTIRRWIRTGDLVAHRLGNQLRIRRTDGETFLKLRRMA